ncbi:MAG: Ig-like domain-containing protein [Chryseolinea sp.]
MKSLHRYLLLAIVVTITHSATGQWMDIGETRLDISFRDANNGIMVGASGLTMKTKDGGQSWFNDQSATEFTTSPLIKVFTFGNNIIALDRSGPMGPSTHIYTSADGGQHWTRKFMSNRYLMIHFINANVGWYWDQSPYKNNEYPYRTTDGGQTWTQTSDILSISTMTSVGTTTWAWSRVGNDNFLSKSTDQGVTWTTLPITPFADNLNNLNSFQFLDDQHGWMSSGFANSFYKTADGGVTWEPVSLPSPNHSASVRSMHFINFNTGVISITDELLLKTTDGGTTWREVHRSPDNFWCHFKKVHFKDATHGFVIGTAGYLATTDDAGETWTQNTFSTVTSNEPIMDLAYNGTDIWAAGDGLRQHSSDSRIWVEDPASNSADNELNSIAFDQHGKGTFSVEKRIYTTTTNGVTWTFQPAVYDPSNAPYLALEKVRYDPAGNLWAIDYNGPLYKSTDGGQTFKLKKQFSSFIALADYVAFQSAQDVWYYGNQQLLRSKDGGNTWTQTNEVVTSMYFLNQQVGWKILPGRVVYKTIDGGDTWKNMGVVNALSDFRFCYFADEFTGWVVDISSHAFKTSDGGKTWTQEATGSDALVNAVAFRVNGNNKVEGYIGGEQLVKLTTDYTPIQALAAPVLSATINNLTVTLQWIDLSTDKDAYIIERLNGSTWQELGRTTTKSFPTNVPAPGIYKYRVSTFKEGRPIAASQVLTVDVKGEPPVTPDTTSPLYTSLSPANGATNADVLTKLIISFNEDIVFKTGTIQLYGGTEPPVPLIVNESNTQADKRALTITMAAPLKEKTQYSIAIPAGIVTDVAGNPFSLQKENWTFTTVSITPPDIESPSVVSMMPALSSTDVDVESTLQITFSEEVVLNGGTLNIVSSSNPGENHTIALTSANVSIEGQTVTITLIDPLPEGATLSIHISAGTFSDVAGNVVDSNAVSWNFSTREATITSIETTVEDWIVADGTDRVTINTAGNGFVIDGIYDVLGRPINYYADDGRVLFSKPAGVFLIRYRSGSRSLTARMYIR